MNSQKNQSIESSMCIDGFWASMNILITKPHVVNKRLWGCKILSKAACRVLEGRILPRLSSIIDDVNSESLERFLLELGLETCNDSSDAEVYIIKLLPKMFTENHAIQLAYVNKKELQCTFYNVTPNATNQNICPEFTYTLRKNSNDVSLLVYCEDDSSSSYTWLKDTVLPQFVKWGEEKSPGDQQSLSSLALVSAEEYYIKYNELKLKYGKGMVKIWPECTDPAKFVYEDIAIATYILLLWADERRQNDTKKLQSFVDLGCGNGLLVYLLAMEGHHGVGIDVRKRNIWDLYPKKVKLEERTITPSDMNLFPETNWLIGNHSDELTPWIPVVAARSAYKCNFFLLPCCAYNFDGTKYQRQNSSKSQYTEFLDHIKDLCIQCGFNTDMDRLKIPSTKRICLVGRSRSYPEEQHENKCKSIQDMISNQTTKKKSDTDTWIDNFKPREATEKVRNCTQIDKSLIESIVKTITAFLVEGINTEIIWSPGKVVGISELVELLSEKELKALKSECGGLQTLLKNNHHIFKVQSGKVQLRYPRSVEEVNTQVKVKRAKVSTIRVKEKPCWFHNNHPQGCPLTDSGCSFLH